jgi:hypothetical protein
MVASGVAQRFDLFILTCLCNVSRRATFGRIPLDEWSARRRDLYLTTHNTHNRQTSMLLVGFEPTISAGEQPKTYVLDRAATGIGSTDYWVKNKFDVVLIVHRRYYVEIKCQLDATDEFLLQILLLAQHVSGTIVPIIRSSRVLYSWLPPVVFGA